MLGFQTYPMDQPCSRHQDLQQTSSGLVLKGMQMQLRVCCMMHVVPNVFFYVICSYDLSPSLNLLLIVLDLRHVGDMNIAIRPRGKKSKQKVAAENSAT